MSMSSSSRRPWTGPTSLCRIPLYTASASGTAMTTAKLIDPGRSYVAGRWVEGDATFARREPGRRVARGRGLGDAARRDRAGRRRGPARLRRRRVGRPAGAERAEPARTPSSTTSTAVKDDLVHTMVAEAGQPRGFAEGAQFGMGMGLARSTIDLYLSMPHEEPNPVPVDELVQGRVALSVRRHEPVGVVAAITPYNAAIIMAFQKVVPGAHRRQLGDPAAEPAHADLVARLRRRRRRRRASRPACSAWSSRRAPPAPSCSPPTPPSTWCRSPAPPRSGGRSSPRRRRR